MGLDLELLRDDRALHARWSYGGFAAFRKRLAAEAGITLSAMVGFGGDKPWATFSEDGIVPLLNHSDCDGYLYYSDCDQILPRLRELTATWDADDYDRQQADNLAAMLAEVVNGDAHAVLFT